jgi:hypothetical protein
MDLDVSVRFAAEHVLEAEANYVHSMQIIFIGNRYLPAFRNRVDATFVNRFAPCIPEPLVQIPFGHREVILPVLLDVALDQIRDAARSRQKRAEIVSKLVRWRLFRASCSRLCCLSQTGSRGPPPTCL